MSPSTSNPRTIYAQSSDIKSRSYLEYRRDMKKKAIAELEFIPYLRALLSEKSGGAVAVEKHGGDRDLWFGKPSQAPDYRATFPDGGAFLYEFQYAEETIGLENFDFKVSKVGKKIRGQRAPHEDREFFYVVKPECQYAFLSPRWIMENGKEAPVPAWGSRPAYRIPREIFLAQCQSGGKRLAALLRIVQGKNILLNFQHRFTDEEKKKFSRQLQAIVDENRILKIVPKTLDGFYQVCFLLSSMDRAPDAPGVWLVYLASFFSADMKAKDFAKFVYALDFLYFKCAVIKDNEAQVVKQALRQATRYIGNCEYDSKGLISREATESPLEQTRQILFALNLLEDVQQDVAVNLGIGDKAEKIFIAVPDPIQTARAIQEEEAA